MPRGVGGHGPANIMKHLKGIRFPVNKQRVFVHAAQGEGPDTNEVLKVLRHIEEKEYHSLPEIMKQMGKPG